MIYAIETNKLCRSFGQKKVLNDITVKIEVSSTVGLLGRNGAGKTTFMSMLMGLLRPTTGAVHVFGQQMPQSRPKIANRINFCSPYLNLPSRLSVWENLFVYSELYGVKRSADRINELSEILALSPLLKRETGTLSAGERSRVVFAKALLNKPELLFLDEPTASMDPVSADILRSTLERYIETNQCTIIIASHSYDEIQRLCSQLIIIANGIAFKTGPISDALAHTQCASLSELYELPNLQTYFK